MPILITIFVALNSCGISRATYLFSFIISVFNKHLWHQCIGIKSTSRSVENLVEVLSLKGE